jgi:hypothetical protein
VEIDNTALTDLSQTWSEPLIGRVKLQEGLTVKDRWVAFVGGGYWHSTTLSANAAAGAATIYIVDNTGFASSGTGTLSIGTEAGINYGSTSATSISGIPGGISTGRITTDHAAGEVVTYSTIGRGFYVIDINLGTVIWKLDAADNSSVRYPMTSSPAGVGSDNDGYLASSSRTWAGALEVRRRNARTFISNLVTAGWAKRIFARRRSAAGLQGGLSFAVSWRWSSSAPATGEAENPGRADLCIVTATRRHRHRVELNASLRSSPFGQHGDRDRDPTVVHGCAGHERRFSRTRSCSTTSSSSRRSNPIRRTCAAAAGMRGSTASGHPWHLPMG